MKYALDSTIFINYFLPEAKHHIKSIKLISQILNKEIEYACLSKCNVIETGNILEQITNDRKFVNQSLYTMLFELNLDIIEFNWDFMVNHSHFKTINPISFCDNAVITAASMTSSQALFTKEKEIVATRVDKIQGADIVFLEDLF